jgi:hypothetical protein
MPQGTSVAPTRPLDILLSRLAEFCISRALCQTFHKDATFQPIEFGCRQIADVRDIPEWEHNIPISISIGFDKTPKTAHQSAKRKSKITVRVNSKLQSLAAR